MIQGRHHSLATCPHQGVTSSRRRCWGYIRRFQKTPLLAPVSTAPLGSLLMCFMNGICLWTPRGTPRALRRGMRVQRTLKTRKRTTGRRMKNSKTLNKTSWSSQYTKNLAKTTCGRTQNSTMMKIKTLTKAQKKEQALMTLKTLPRTLQHHKAARRSEGNHARHTPATVPSSRWTHNRGL